MLPVVQSLHSLRYGCILHETRAAKKIHVNSLADGSATCLSVCFCMILWLQAFVAELIRRILAPIILQTIAR